MKRAVTVLIAAVAVLGHAWAVEFGVQAFEGTTLTQEQKVRRVKCRVIWQASAPWSYSPKLADFWCSEHERYGIPSLWWYSLANMRWATGLNPRMRTSVWPYARGLCDCTQLNAGAAEFAGLGTIDLMDPRVSIRNHCIEASRYAKQTGRVEWSLLRKVFLPGNPDGSAAWACQRQWLVYDQIHRGYWAQWCRKYRSRVPQEVPGVISPSTVPVYSGDVSSKQDNTTGESNHDTDRAGHQQDAGDHEGQD